MLLALYCPSINRLGHIVFALSISSELYLFVKKLKIGRNFLMLSDRAFISHTCIPLGKTFIFVSKSMSSVKVKYKGHIFQCNGGGGGTFVIHKHNLVLDLELNQ